ncbi:MAG: cyanophycinase [Hymenobacteraceae bacterium]|nr:cyanophycinase [Hymenobacteraceae bacterium]
MADSTPLGILVLIGGSEDRGPANTRPPLAEHRHDYIDQEILQLLVYLTGKRQPRIGVVVSASNLPHEMADMYVRAYAHLGHHNLTFIDLRQPETPNSEEALAWLRALDVVLFSGGDQERLLTQTAGTRFLALLHARYQTSGLVIAGTSAGSMAFPRRMLIAGAHHEAMLSGDVELADGMNLLGGCLVDTHFVRRGRFGRLTQAVLLSPQHVGIGLGEDTALVVRHGTVAECVGSGMAVIIDGHERGPSNVDTAPEGAPLYAADLRVHCLVRGNRYGLGTRRFRAS